MIFRQLFDSVSSTYSYRLASRRGGEALIMVGNWSLGFQVTPPGAPAFTATILDEAEG